MNKIFTYKNISIYMVPFKCSNHKVSNLRFLITLTINAVSFKYCDLLMYNKVKVAKSTNQLKLNIINIF